MTHYTDQEKSAIVIFAGHVARQLLKRGYTIIDVKADRTNKIKSVFIFKRENDIERVLAEITKKSFEEEFAEPEK
jgi:predicted GNAT superfamily acetyltransferase